jgi:hypothetical protein
METGIFLEYTPPIAALWGLVQVPEADKPLGTRMCANRLSSAVIIPAGVIDCEMESQLFAHAAAVAVSSLRSSDDSSRSGPPSRLPKSLDIRLPLPR